MKAVEIPGVRVERYDVGEDRRGSFSEPCTAAGEFGRLAVAQNRHRHTLRGLHYREGASEEEKFVTCSRGIIYDVLLDLRLGSPTHMRWFAVGIAPGTGVRIPRGVAHGYMTLEDDTDVVYLLSGQKPPDDTRRGVRWCDPAVSIEWPAIPRVISDLDAAWPLL